MAENVGASESGQVAGTSPILRSSAGMAQSERRRHRLPSLGILGWPRTTFRGGGGGKEGGMGRKRSKGWGDGQHKKKEDTDRRRGGEERK